MKLADSSFPGPQATSLSTAGWGLAACAAVLWWVGLPALASGQEAKKWDPTRWEKAVQAFEEADRQEPTKPGGIVFVGSSSIRLWQLEQSFPGLPVLNRGFGGSQLADAVHFADRLILKHKPRLVVVYAGDNDLAAGKTPEQIAQDFRALVRLIEAALPGTRIIFLAVKPSPRRWDIAEKQRRANHLVAQMCKADRRLTYLDVFTPMLGNDGQPRAELFLKDRLHLNEEGYRLWATLLRPHLK